MTVGTVRLLEIVLENDHLFRRGHMCCAMCTAKGGKYVGSTFIFPQGTGNQRKVEDLGFQQRKNG